MFAFTTFLAGLVFGLGLMLSGMVKPAKVQAFLDLAGNWDPSLLLVMAGANAVAAVAFALAARRTESLLHTPLQVPVNRRLDPQLVVGSLLFGAGWGLAGFCPGPALVSLGTLQPKALVFVAAMVAGMLVFELLERVRARAASAPA
jgi:uncharacterized membrane protein YedE/YeeE